MTSTGFTFGFVSYGGASADCWGVSIVGHKMIWFSQREMNEGFARLLLEPEFYRR